MKINPLERRSLDHQLSANELMTYPQTPLKKGISMNTSDVIHYRRSVRTFTSETVSKSTVSVLLEAATCAPTARDQQPWAFGIIQDRKTLDRLSDSAKKQIQIDDKAALSKLHVVEKPDFHVFYNAGTLIIIYGKFTGPFVEADCWLAAENLLLMACSEGLGACVIGFAVPSLNTPEWKSELNIPAEMTAIAPIIVGIPLEETSPVSRKPPKILTWR